MCKLFIAFVFMAISVYSIPFPQTLGTVTSKDDAKNELMKAGLSETAAVGIIEISDKYMKQFQNMRTDVDNFLLTQSAADQQAYKAFSDKLTAHFNEASESGFQ